MEEPRMEHVTAARILRPYVLELTFTDGTHGEIDLESELYGEVFEPLRDPAYFALGELDAVIGTVVWPNGADFAPEFLYDCAALSQTKR
jgi:hypothetical protein